MTKNIRLAFVANGRSVHTVTWVRYFADRGYDVHLITFASKPIKGVKIHGLEYFGKFDYPLRIWAIRRAVKRICPDILQAHYISHYGVYAALTSFHPLILRAMGSDIAVDPEKSKFHRFPVKFALKTADVVKTLDNVGRKRLIKLGCNKNKIVVQPDGVDTEHFSPQAHSRLLREKLGIDKKYSVLNARCWENKYRVDVLIKAIPLVLREIPNVKFIMLGGGALEYELKELARKSKVHENILFIGKIPHNQMAKYLASVDLYVDTSTDYRIDSTGNCQINQGGSGMGQTTKEAMACGTPQILGDRISFMSCQWFQGITYRQLDSKDLAEKIVQLLSDKKFRKKISKKSRKAVLKFDLQKTMKKWENLYSKLHESIRSKT